MASTGQWEVVTSKSKKSRQENGQVKNKLTREEKKKFFEKAPKLTDVLTLGEVETIYSALEEKPEKRPEKENKVKDVEPKRPQKKKQEKKKEVKEKPPKTVEEAVRTISLDEIKDLLDTVQTRFHDSPIIWLKDLASYLNVKLEVEDKDPVFLSKPKDYPVCLLPKDIQKELLKTVSSCPSITLNALFEHLMLSMVGDISKGLTTLGYKMFIQLLVHHNSALVTQNMSKYESLLNSYQNQHTIGLSILWVAGQGGMKNLQLGLKVWLQLMLPLLSSKHYSKFVIDYLASLFTKHCDVDSVSQGLGVKEFFRIMDCVFMPATSLQPSIHKELMGLYPKLKTVAFGTNPEVNLRNFFPHFLERLQPSISGPLSDELLTCLVLCLGTDHHCFNVWRQVYTKRTTHSTLLLRHLARTWPDVASSLPRKTVQETLNTFKVTSEEMFKHKKNIDNLQSCRNACEELSSKMGSFTFPWKFGSFLLTLAITGLLAYDIQKNGTFRDSSTGNFLKDIGALHYCEHAWSKARMYSEKAQSWAEHSVPYYCAMIYQQIQPFLQLLWEKIVCVGHCLYHSFENIKEYVIETAPQVKDWVNQQFPGFTEQLHLAVTQLWESTKQYSLLAWDLAQHYTYIILAWTQHYMHIVLTWTQHYLHIILAWTQHYVYIVLAWLRENVFTGKLSPENLQKYTVEAIDITQYYVVTAYQWIMQQVQKISN